MTLKRDFPIVGREPELGELLDTVGEGKPALMLVSGAPRMGKGQVLRELKARSSNYPCVPIPEDVSPDGRPWLTIDRLTTPESFLDAVTPASTEAFSSLETVDHQSSWLGRLNLIFVYGYRPDERFNTWFTEDFLPGLRTSRPPRIVVLAGYVSDFEELEPHASRHIVLGPLPREAVEASLRALNDEISDKLDDAEMAAYIDAVTNQPSLFVALQILFRQYLTAAT